VSVVAPARAQREAAAVTSPAPLSRRDVGVAIAALLLSLLLYAPGGGADAARGEVAASVLLSVAQSAPLVWRRQRPALVAAFVLGVAFVHAVLLGPVAPWPSWFALYAVVRHTAPLPRAIVMTGAAAVGAIVVFATGPALHGAARDALLLTLALTAVAVLLAALVRTEQGRLEALRQRAASLERERDTAAREAAAAERLRIARDLHDLVGHGLSSMAVQSSSARLLLDAGDVGAARQRMAAVETASRAAMQEMRQLLDVLRERQDHDRTPSPGIFDIEGLVEATRAGGLDVSLEVHGTMSAAPASGGLAAYRIVQESLTNVLKHAPGARVTVRLDVDDTGIVLEVRNHGGVRRREFRDRGHGVIGMRERVAALGGTISIGPVDDEEGWQVLANLPGRSTS
jgi:signal transduction histidine kinase